MSDQIKRQWEEKWQQKLSEREKFIDASSERQHGDWLVNKTKAPIAISGVGEDIIENNRRIKNVLFLKVLGEDDEGGGFADIRQFTDAELDKSKNYQDLLRKGWIQELTEEDYRVMLDRAYEYRYRLQHDYQFYWQVRKEEMFRSQMYLPPSYERNTNPIIEIDLKTGREILSPEKDWAAAGINISEDSFGTMSSYYRTTGY